MAIEKGLYAAPQGIEGEVLPEEEEVPKDAVVCYSSACKNSMTKQGIPWKDP